MTAMITAPVSRAAVNVAPVSGAPVSVAVPAGVLPHRGPAELLTMAVQGLAEAEHTTSDGLRYAAAHLAALRAAAAVLAARARPEPRRRNRITSVWTLLNAVAPELGEWAEFFAAGASKRVAAEAGIPRVVTAREADDLVRSAREFIEVAAGSIDLAYQPTLV
jgi:hypothetical protein